jgi:hypothetical protein
MTAASWPRTLLVPADAARQWQTLREALLAVRGTPCAAAPDVWNSRNQSDIKAASDACHPCPAFTACDSYATAANEATGVWAGRDRAAKQSKGKTA